MPRQDEIGSIPVPFADLSSHKRRPVIIISNDAYNRKSPDVIVVALTSNPAITDCSFRISSTDLAQGALNRPGTGSGRQDLHSGADDRREDVRAGHRKRARPYPPDAKGDRGDQAVRLSAIPLAETARRLRPRYVSCPLPGTARVESGKTEASRPIEQGATSVTVSLDLTSGPAMMRRGWRGRTVRRGALLWKCCDIPPNAHVNNRHRSQAS